MAESWESAGSQLTRKLTYHLEEVLVLVVAGHVEDGKLQVEPCRGLLLLSSGSRSWKGAGSQPEVGQGHHTIVRDDAVWRYASATKLDHGGTAQLSNPHHYTHPVRSTSASAVCDAQRVSRFV